MPLGNAPKLTIAPLGSAAVVVNTQGASALLCGDELNAEVNVLCLQFTVFVANNHLHFTFRNL